jgi:hypothetical protein
MICSAPSRSFRLFSGVADLRRRVDPPWAGDVEIDRAAIELEHMVRYDYCRYDGQRESIGSVGRLV